MKTRRNEQTNGMLMPAALTAPVRLAFAQLLEVHELARASGAPFITMNSVQLEADDVDFLLSELRRSNFSREEDMETARQLRAHFGRIGFIQLGFPYQGVMFLCELSTEWYEGYKALQEMADDLGGIMIDGSSADGMDEDER